MKKLLCAFLALMACVAYTRAADGITIADVNLPKGGDAVVEVQLISAELSYAGFQFDIVLPKGISLTKVEKADRLTAIDGYTLSKSLTDSENNIYTVLGYNSDRQIIEGTTGAIVFLTLTASDELTIGNVFDVPVQDIVLTTVNEEQIDADASSFSITIDEPDDGFIKFYETSTKLPTYTAGEKGNVRMTRTIKADTWSTIVLPFTLTKAKAEAAFGSDVQLAEFSGFEVDYGDDEENVIPLGITINFATYTMTAKKGMTGGKPFLIKTSKDITGFEAEECSLVSAVTDVTKTDEFDTEGKFTGTLVKSVVPADGLFINNEKFYYSTGATNIKAFRGWFELGAVLDKETDFGVKLCVDGFETKVEGLGVKDAAGHVYDLSGRKVSKAQRGVYIVNDKKVLVK